MFQFEVLQQPVPVRTEGKQKSTKKPQEEYWKLQPRFVEHNGKKKRKI
jgi:hypothetical protein